MPNATIYLNEFATVPTYNIKAVVRATGISPSTLRAWERRYNMTQPQRSESGYRLYSERDVAVIRWLKAQVDAGMAISQAVAWLEEQGGEHALELPGGLAATHPASATGNSALTVSDDARDAVHSFQALRAALLAALVGYDERAADGVLAEAFTLYPLTSVAEEIITPVLVEIGEQWHRGALSVVSEHYASNYLLQRMGAWLRATHDQPTGPALWVACAPDELHEAGALLLALYLRRMGYAVRYLGQNVPLDDLTQEIEKAAPAPEMILLSASTAQGAAGLRAVADAMTDAHARSRSGAPRLGFGGSYYVRNPGARAEVGALWLGATAQDGAHAIHNLFSATNGKAGNT